MDTRKAHVEQVRAQILMDGYRVDPEAVADAIVRRLLALRSGADADAADA